jgi:hypothetical protein
LEGVAAQTAMAMDMLAHASEAARHRAAVEHLLRISYRLVGRRSVEETLGTVCEGIRDALRFRIVATFLYDERAGVFRLTAEAGLAPTVAAAVDTLPATPVRRPSYTASTSPSATGAARARGPATGCRSRCATPTAAWSA